MRSNAARRPIACSMPAIAAMIPLPPWHEGSALESLCAQERARRTPRESLILSSPQSPRRTPQTPLSSSRLPALSIDSLQGSASARVASEGDPTPRVVRRIRRGNVF